MSTPVYQISAPDPFNFKSTLEWKSWKDRFMRFRRASGMMKEEEARPLNENDPQVQQEPDELANNSSSSLRRESILPVYPTPSEIAIEVPQLDGSSPNSSTPARRTQWSRKPIDRLDLYGWRCDGSALQLCEELHFLFRNKLSVPEDYVTKEIFDAVSVYIIPKPQLQRTILTVNVLGYKITGYPVRIDNTKYARNAYYFNLCFVCDSWARTVQYEPVVKKLSEYLVIPFINGFNHVAKIAAEANVENNLVKACIQNLLYYGTVKLIPIFQYSNIYAATPELKNLTEKKAFQKECLEYVSKTSETLASFRDVFVFYCNMTHGTTLRDLCARFNPHFIHIDERKLVQFGLLHKLIRRIHKFPVCVGSSARSSPLPFLHQTFNGQSSYDEICCKMGISSRQLAEQIEDDPRILVIRK
uniref:Nitrogen permease regulator 2-like protein n=1 Tax=Timema shepardi TaxID=629360 RepID=A0A7R9B748_TIMSH|nr:unnamed protein product [Timema shepardi]